MLNKKQFFDYVETLRNIVEKRDALEEIGLDASNFYEDVYYAVDLVIDSNFDEKGSDVFFAWFYDNQTRVEDNDGTVYLIEDVNSLWNFLIKHYNYEPTKEIPCIY